MWRWAAGLTVLCAQLACVHPAPRNVVVVLADALRADHLSLHGYGRATSPSLDAFAREHIYFENVRSQASCTFPSVNSMLSSRWPFEFMLKEDTVAGVGEDLPYLPALLQSAGYRTVALTASPVFRHIAPALREEGLPDYARGFDVFVEEGLTWADAAAVNARLRELLSVERQRPLFLYLHYMDPHSPYHDRPGGQKFSKAYRGHKEYVRRGTVGPIEAMLYDGGPQVEVTPHDIEHLVDLYDEEIAYFDRHFSGLVEILKGNGLWRDTMIVVASDHGEAFMEHGHIHHCNCLYEVAVRVPLMVRIPGLRSRRACSQGVSNVDIAPTVLDYVGLDAGRSRMQGRSLRTVIERNDPADVVAFGWNGAEISATGPRHKLIHNVESGRSELYDLQIDPNETHDVATLRPRARDALLETLLRWRGVGHSHTDLRDRLRALGYLQ